MSQILVEPFDTEMAEYVSDHESESESESDVSDASDDDGFAFEAERQAIVRTQPRTMLITRDTNAYERLDSDRRRCTTAVSWRRASGHDQQ